MTKLKVVSAYLLLVVYAILYPTRDNWEFPRTQTQFDLPLQNLEVSSNNSIWKGRLATFLNVKESNFATHTQFQSLNEKLLRSFGNDYSDAGVWIEGIPTLTEYNHSISPASYFFLRSILGKPNDQYHRNLLFFRSVNVDFMRILGIKYLVTDSKIAEMGVPVAISTKNDYTLYMYQINSPNLNGILVERVWRMEEWSAIVDRFKLGNRVSSEAYSLDFEMPPNSSTLKKSLLSLSARGYRYQGESEGESLVLLPIEYSKCFQTSGSAKEYELLRLNGFMLGIKFRDRVDVNLEYAYGPFVNPFCRIMDYLDFKDGL